MGLALKSATKFRRIVLGLIFVSERTIERHHLRLLSGEERVVERFAAKRALGSARQAVDGVRHALARYERRQSAAGHVDSFPDTVFV